MIFVFAAISDFFDGRIAHKKNIVTDFGKLMDPIADKILVLDEGKLAACGNHKELIRTCQHYRELYELQLSGQYDVFEKEPSMANMDDEFNKVHESVTV